MKKLILILLLLFIAPASAQTINNLTGGAAIQNTDILPAYQGANPATGVTAAQIKTFANTSAVNAQVGTTYAIATTDQGKLVTFSNAASVAVSIAQATSGTFFNGWAVSLKNIGAGTVTLTATTSLIYDGSSVGSSTMTLTTGQGVDLYSDGSNYFTQPGKASGTVTSVTCGTGLTGGTFTTTGTCALALNSAVLSGHPSNPTGTTATSPGVMMGLGVTTCRFTPTYSTRVEFLIEGQVANSGTNATALRSYFGTGAGPANGGAVAGTAMLTGAITYTSTVANANLGFTLSDIVTGLTAGTTYWFDLNVFVSAGTGTVTNVTCTAKEML